MITLTITNPDGTKFIVGSFPTQADADAWLANAQAAASWITGTTSTRVVKSTVILPMDPITS